MMNAPAIDDFSAAERQQVDALLLDRFGRAVLVEAADSELRLDPSIPVLTSCPTLYFSQHDCHFLLFKVGERRYRCQFFYTEDELYGAGATEFDDLQRCLTALLRAQADLEKERKGVRSGLTGDQIEG
ncbi:MAG: hypothetical protein WA373_11195 [Burkholderiales bacterium]